MEVINKNNFYDFKRILRSDYYKKILIISGKKSFYASGANLLINKVIKKKEYSLFFKKKKLPEIEEIKKLIKKINSYKPNLILAIGGGSVLDIAKIANSMFETDDLKRKIIRSNYIIKKNFCDLISIPTTAGSGAEVTTNAVIYIGKKKYSIEDGKIKPTHAILFPKLIISNTEKIKNSSAFDALSQSIESLISVKSNQKSIYYSKKSIKIFLDNYQKYIGNKNLEYAYKMSLAAFYSGKAISITKTTAPHAVSYPFTSYFGINHGHAVSLTLSEFLRFNYENKKNSVTKFNLNDRYKILFSLFKIKTIDELILELEIIKNSFNLEGNFQKLNKQIIPKIDLIVNNVNVQRLTNNPVRIKKRDIFKILKNKIFI